MLCCTYFDPTNCHPQHLSRNLVVYKTMQVTKTDCFSYCFSYLHSRKLDISETENTYISTFFVHFVENINNIILYVHCTMYILYSIVKDGDLKKTDAKNAFCCKFPAVISCFFTKILFRPGLENLRCIYNGIGLQQYVYLFLFQNSCCNSVCRFPVLK